MNKDTIILQLSDYEIERLNKGFSVNVGNVLITFAEGSKRRVGGEK